MFSLSLFRCGLTYAYSSCRFVFIKRTKKQNIYLHLILVRMQIISWLSNCAAFDCKHLSLLSSSQRKKSTKFKIFSKIIEIVLLQCTKENITNGFVLVSVNCHNSKELNFSSGFRIKSFVLFDHFVGMCGLTTEHKYKVILRVCTVHAEVRCTYNNISQTENENTTL